MKQKPIKEDLKMNILLLIWVFYHKKEDKEMVAYLSLYINKEIGEEGFKEKTQEIFAILQTYDLFLGKGAKSPKEIFDELFPYDFEDGYNVYKKALTDDTAGGKA